MLTTILMQMLVASTMHAPVDTGAQISTDITSYKPATTHGVLVAYTPRQAPGPDHGDDPHREIHGSDPYNWSTGNGSDPYGGSTSNGSDPYGGLYPGAGAPKDPYGGNVPD